MFHLYCQTRNGEIKRVTCQTVVTTGNNATLQDYVWSDATKRTQPSSELEDYAEENDTRHVYLISSKLTLIPPCVRVATKLHETPTTVLLTPLSGVYGLVHASDIMT